MERPAEREIGDLETNRIRRNNRDSPANGPFGVISLNISEHAQRQRGFDAAIDNEFWSLPGSRSHHRQRAAARAGRALGRKNAQSQITLVIKGDIIPKADRACGIAVELPGAIPY